MSYPFMDGHSQNYFLHIIQNSYKRSNNQKLQFFVLRLSCPAVNSRIRTYQSGSSFETICSAIQNANDNLFRIFPEENFSETRLLLIVCVT